MSETTELAQQVADLTTSTTNLTETVVGQMTNLSVDVGIANDKAAEAKQSAVEAEDNAVAANTHRANAKVEADRSQAAADNAVAVVSGGEASLTSEAGKIPIADAEGKIDLSWLPVGAKVMSKSEFFALADIRKKNNAGSGEDSHALAVTDVFDCPATESDTFIMKERRRLVNGFPIFMPERKVKTPAAPDGSIVVHEDGTQTEYPSAAQAIAGYAGLDYTAEVGGWSYSSGSSGTEVVGFSDYIHFNTTAADAGWKLAKLALGVDLTAKYYMSFELFDVVIGGSIAVQFCGAGSTDTAKNLDITEDGRIEFEFDMTEGASDYTADDVARFQVSPNSERNFKIRNIQVRKASDKPLMSRKDFAFTEVWLEKISDKGRVFMYGDVQSEVDTWNGLTAVDNAIDQGYSALGDWDTETKGFSFDWANMTDAQRLGFINEPDNHIFEDDGELVMVMYRRCIVKGFGDTWLNTIPYTGDQHYMQYGGLLGQFIKPRGALTNNQSYANGGLWLTPKSALDSYQDKSVSHFVLRDVFDNLNVAHDDHCYAVPLTLISKRNSGAHSKVYNANGTAGFAWSDNEAGQVPWYDLASKKKIVEKNDFDCMARYPQGAKSASLEEGLIGNGFSGRRDNLRADAIYQSDLEPLYMSTKKKPLAEIREAYKRQAIAGEVVGHESVPFLPNLRNHSMIDQTVTPLTLDFTVVRGTYGTVVNANNAQQFFQNKHVLPNTRVRVTKIDYAGGNSGSMLFRFTVGGVNTEQVSLGAIGSSAELDIHSGVLDYIYIGHNGGEYGAFRVETLAGGIYELQTHTQANPTWTDIIGDPARIAATFPDGVEGQWIPVIPDATTQTFNFNRKNVEGNSIPYTRSTNMGETWGSGNVTVDSVLNAFISTRNSNEVGLMHYETQAHFTEDSVNSEVLDLGDVFGTNSFSLTSGNLMLSSLIGKVATGLSSIKGREVPLDSYVLDANNELENTLGKAPTHTNVPYTYYYDSVAIKTVSMLTESYGVIEFGIRYKELHPTGGGYGDNFAFEGVDNQSTLTDDNGNTVKYGTAKFKTHYFYSGEE